MKRARFLFTALLACWSLVVCAQQPSPSEPQDVPKQTPPGTNNPDISKQRRPTPDPPPGNTKDQNSSDVPHQQPGPDNPDVGKQRGADKNGPSDDGNNKSRNGSAKPARQKAKKKKSDTASK